MSPTLRAGGNSSGGDRPPGTDVDTADSLLICASNGEGSRGLPFLTCANLAKTVNNQTPLRAMAAAPVLTFSAHAQPDEMRFDPHVTASLTCSQQQAVCVTGDITHTLKAEGFDASEDGTGRGQPITAAWAIGSHAGAADGDQTNRSHASGGPVGSNISAELAYSLRAGRTQSVATTMAVRRLTPRECERLQGFPDDYTLVPMDRRKAPREGERRGEPRMMADGPRYKALGNSMAVPCMRWLGVRLMLTHPDYFY